MTREAWLKKLLLQLAVGASGAFCIMQALANERIAYANWLVDLGAETAEAYTANESNASFGLFCNGASCVFYLNPKLNCQPNTKNMVLMNGSSMSAAIGMRCALVGKHYFQILDSFDQVYSNIKSSDNIGFAVALQGGAFSVYQFNLSGAMQAIQRALDEASKNRESKVNRPSINKNPEFKVINL